MQQLAVSDRRPSGSIPRAIILVKLTSRAFLGYSLTRIINNVLLKCTRVARDRLSPYKVPQGIWQPWGTRRNAVVTEKRGEVDDRDREKTLIPTTLVER